MRKAIAALILVGAVVAGCGNPSLNTPSAASHSPLAVKQTAEPIAVLESKSFPLTYITSVAAQSLEPIASIEQSQQLQREAFEGSIIFTYKKNEDAEGIYAALERKDGTYDLGQIGYEGASDYSAKTVDALGKAYLKVTGLLGANAPVSNYVSLDSTSPTLLHIEAHTVEADVDQDGTQEIIATVGTVAETFIYKLQKDSLVSVSLNEAMNATIVFYDQESNTFKAEVPKGELSQWKIENNTLVPYS